MWCVTRLSEVGRDDDDDDEGGDDGGGFLVNH